MLTRTEKQHILMVVLFVLSLGVLAHSCGDVKNSKLGYSIRYWLEPADVDR